MRRLLAIGAACAVVACSPQATTADPVDAEEAEEATARAEELLREVQVSHGSYDDNAMTRLVRSAESRLITACLQEAGVDHEMPDPAEHWEAGRPPLEWPDGPEIWLAEDLSVGVSEQLADPSVRQQVAEGPPSLDVPQAPEGFEEAYRGDPPETVQVEAPDGQVGQVVVGGCVGEATEELFGVDPAEYHRTRFAVSPRGDIHSTVIARPEVADAVEDWSRCLRGEGIRIESPDGLAEPLEQAVQQVVEGDRGVDHMEEVEESLESADRVCKDASGLRGVYAAAFAEEAEDVLREIEPSLVAYQEMWDHAIERAERLVTADP